MKISLFYKGPPHQGLSEARGGKELFCIFSHQSTAAASLRGGGVHHSGSIEVPTLSSYLDYPIFVVPV
jgi:hypothetical protein